MTDDELILHAFSEIKSQIEEEFECEKESNTPSEYKDEILADYAESLEVLEILIPKIRGIDSLYDTLDEEEFSVAVEFLEEFYENFVIDGRTEESLKHTEGVYFQLSDIMFELYGEFDEEDGEGDE